MPSRLSKKAWNYLPTRRVLKRVLSKIWHLSKENKKIVPDGWDCEEEVKGSEEAMTGENKREVVKIPADLDR